VLERLGVFEERESALAEKLRELEEREARVAAEEKALREKRELFAKERVREKKELEYLYDATTNLVGTLLPTIVKDMRRAGISTARLEQYVERGRSLQGLLADARARVDTVTTHHPARETDLEKREHSVLELESKLIERENLLAEKERELSKREAELKRREAAFSAKSREKNASSGQQ
jgi:hypothetical protein